PRTLPSCPTRRSSDLFAIDASTGVVKVADASLLNYEDATSHSITVKAADPSGHFTTQDFTIAVTDVAPTTPVDSDGAAGGSISGGAAHTAQLRTPANP